jgi:tripartite-type tricarboxylate transporter receptor subunit TctC
MAGLVPAIHVCFARSKKDVDARHKAGHDGGDVRMRWLSPVLVAVLAATATSQSHAQTYPSHPIRVIVPFAAGGAVDVLARLLGNKLSDQLGQPVVIENKPGAGGTLAADMVAKSAPDGYTILQNTNGAAIAPGLYKSLPFDAEKDFAPVTQVVASNLILVASPKSGITSVKDLIDKAKAKPGSLNYGSSGLGNPLHLTMEMFKHETGIDILAVPFRGDAQINAALITGDVEVAVVPLATAVPLINDGRIRALGITGAKRSPTVPDVPTIAESGVPNFASTSWQGWFMAAKTPAPVVQRIQQETAKALGLPDVRARLGTMAYEGIGSTPADFDAFYKTEIVKFAKVIADAKIPKQ